ncbi:SpaA isopeptide-forming pilin-related protein [Listeria rustica]|nr:SpaA isopeptide-forming pilin-related protein [Listeria rustica]
MKTRKYVAILMIVLLSLQLGTLFTEATVSKTVSKSNTIKTSITVNPGIIKSREEVNVLVNISASAGAFLTEQGKITVTIPKEIVYNINDFNTKMIIPAPFKLDRIDKDAKDYVLLFSVDTDMIGANDAFTGTFQIKFGAPILKVGDEHADTQNFTVEYAGDKQQASVNIQREHKLILPIFDKWYKGDFDENGIANLNTTSPEENRFQLVVNYRGIDLKDVKVADTLPEGTTLITATKRTSVTGDSMVKDNIRIMKVTGFDDEGTAITYKYVTDEFQDKIAYDKANNSFSVDFGDIGADETYFVEYALAIDNLNFGTPKNRANFTASNSPTIEKEVAVQAITHYGTSYILNKSVDKTSLNHDENELNYTLKLELLDGDAIPAGTVITDPLSAKMISPEIAAYDTSKFDIKLEDNKLLITTLKNIQKGEVAEWHFKVNVRSLQMGEELSNQAFLTLPNNVIYSNSVSTRKYDGRIQIKKVDNLGQPVQGAHYEIVNDKKELVFEGRTNAEGLLISKALKLGNYTVTETEAPVGYILDSTPYYVVVSDADTVPIILGTENKLRSGTVALTKIDAENQQLLLEGATFELQDGEGKVLFTELVTDAAGEIVVSGLMPGSYQFIETEAPKGYTLDGTPVTFDIELGENNVAVRVSKQNSREARLVPGDSEPSVTPLHPPMEAPKSPVEHPIQNVVEVPVDRVVKVVSDVEKLPKTGDLPASRTIAFGLGLATLGLAVLIRRKKG